MLCLFRNHAALHVDIFTSSTRIADLGIGFEGTFAQMFLFWEGIAEKNDSGKGPRQLRVTTPNFQSYLYKSLVS